MLLCLSSLRKKRQNSKRAWDILSTQLRRRFNPSPDQLEPERPAAQGCSLLAQTISHLFLTHEVVTYAAKNACASTFPQSTRCVQSELSTEAVQRMMRSEISSVSRLGSVQRRWEWRFSYAFYADHRFQPYHILRVIIRWAASLDRTRWTQGALCGGVDAQEFLTLYTCARTSYRSHPCYS